MLNLKQPSVMKDYNHGMGSVDVFDAKSAAYKVRRKSRKYWKALFYDYLEIAAVNSFILFQLYRMTHPGDIDRPLQYDHEEYRVNLVRQFGNMTADSPVPLYQQCGVQDLPPRSCC